MNKADACESAEARGISLGCRLDDTSQVFDGSLTVLTVEMGAEQSQSAAIPEEKSVSDVTVGSPSALVVCGPSGVGKGTLIELLLEDCEGFAFSVSHTTREPRSNEEVNKAVSGSRESEGAV